MNEVLQAIKSRRSVRKYKEDQIKEEELDAILEAGMYAPTAGNEQPWHFTVVQNPELLRHINEKVREQMVKSEHEMLRRMGSNPAFQATYDAPTLIIVSGKKDGMAWQADCSAAIQNMMLAAESLNLGSVWLGMLKQLFLLEDEVAKLGIPVGYEPFYGVSIGYKVNEKSAEAPKRNRDVVNYIR